MGCGASALPRESDPRFRVSDGHTNLLNNNNNLKYNGQLPSRKSIKTNSVSPLDIVDTTNNVQSSNHDESVVSVKVPTENISTGEVSTANDATMVQIKKVFVKDKHVQCINLLPEDELDVLMQEDAYANDKSSFADNETFFVDKSSSAAEDGENIFCESYCQTIVSLQKIYPKDEIGVGDKLLKVRRYRRSEDVSSLYNGQRSEDEDICATDNNLSPDILVTLSESSLSPLDADAISISREDANAKLSSSSSESQTDAIITAVAATSGGIEPSITSGIHSLDVTTPLAHIESASKCQEAKGRMVNTSASTKKFDEKLQKCLNQLLHDMDTDNEINPLRVNRVVGKVDVSVQTYNDPITDESPEFAARPPASKKKEMIPNVSMFKSIDEKVAQITLGDDIKSLVEEITKDAPNDLYKVRAIFKWITCNIKYDWNCIGKNYTINQLFENKRGICKDFCAVFGEMCKISGIRVKLIQGFAKGFDHKPGYCFKPGTIRTTTVTTTTKLKSDNLTTDKNGDNLVAAESNDDLIHNWNAVYILGSWRLIDTTWGTGFTDYSGQFITKLNEHFFLTDPEILIHSHYPFDPNEDNYDRWQLLDKPLSLDQFNDLPKVTPSFFDYNLKIRSKIKSPHAFKIQCEIKISAHEPMRYKYKLYSADETENSSLNHFVFCCLKEDRLIGSFTVAPPMEGKFYLKVYAKPEREMLAGQVESSNLHSVVTFILDCIKCRRYLEPFPLNELPWGPTQAFFNYKMRIHNLPGPVILSWGGKRKLLIESVESMLTTIQLFDSEGNEMDIRTYVMAEEKVSGTGQVFSFTITPPRQGMFKFLIFGMPKPKQKGKWRLPLLASFLVDCKIAKISKKDPNEEDPPPINVGAGGGGHYSSTTTSIASSSSSTANQVLVSNNNNPGTS